MCTVREEAVVSSLLVWEGFCMLGREIREVLKRHTDELMGMPGVVGVAEGESQGRPCIKVFVIKTTPELEKKIPRDLEGYKIKIEETGKVKAYPES